MRLFQLIITIILFTTHPASATPPQVVKVSETLLGVNDTHVFALRRLDDNLGFHQPTQTDVVLIARNRDTNADDQIWPVMRMIDHGVSFADDGFETRVDPLPLNNRINPFDILLWHKARPLLAQRPANPEERDMVVTREHSALTIISDDAMFQLQDAAVAELFTTSLNTTRATLPAYFIEGGDRGFDSLRDVEFDPKQDCFYHDFTTLYDYNSGDYREFWIASVTCENEETLSPISIILMIPQVK